MSLSDAIPDNRPHANHHGVQALEPVWAYRPNQPVALSEQKPETKNVKNECS